MQTQTHPSGQIVKKKRDRVKGDEVTERGTDTVTLTGALLLLFLISLPTNAFYTQYTFMPSDQSVETEQG